MSYSQGAVFELHKSGWRCSRCRKWLITRKTKGSIHQITQQEGGMAIGSHAESKDCAQYSITGKLTGPSVQRGRGIESLRKKGWTSAY
ncbi:unnamed protein product [Eretmochelys imbricata]